MTSVKFGFRLLTAFLAGIAGLGASLALAHYIKIEGSGLVLLVCALLLIAAFAGYFEPVATRVCVHIVVLILPLLAALTYGVMTCRGHGCASFVVLAVLGSLFTFLVLIAVSFAGFFVRRRFGSNS